MLEVMKPHSSRLWKLRRLEIKGDSVFYSKCIGESQVRPCASTELEETLRLLVLTGWCTPIVRRP